MNDVNTEQNKLMRIAEDFVKFLKEEAEKEHMSEDDVQEIIRQFLQ